MPTTNPSSSLSKHEKPRGVRSTRKLGAIFGTRTVFGTGTTRAVFGTQVADSDVDVIRITLPTPRPRRPSPPPRSSSPPRPPSRLPPPSPPRTKAPHRHGSIFTVFPDLDPTPREHEGEGESGSMYSGQESRSMYSSTSSNSSLTVVQQEPGAELPTDPHPNTDLPTPTSFSSSRAKRRKGVVERPPSSSVVERPPSVMVERPQLLVLKADNTDAHEPCSPMSPFVTTSSFSSYSSYSYPYSTTPHPPSPHIHTPPEPEIRRRRMAKLAWTFGEDVPPEYVFPADSEGMVCEERARLPPRSIPPRSTPPAHLNPTPAHSARSAPRKSSRVWTTSGDGGLWFGEWNRKDIGEVQSRLRALRVR